MTEELKKYLQYNPETGVLTWIKKPSQPIKLYSIAGNTCPKTGYIRIRFKNKAYMAHDLAMYLKGYDKKDLVIDHINGVRNDNRFENLRLTTARLNNSNTYKHRAGKLVGYYFDKSRGKFHSAIKIEGKPVHIGYFNTALEAHNAYLNARQIYCGY